jgi:hypothetical protein
MTNEGLYLAISVPIVLNSIFNGFMFLAFSASINKRFDDMRDLWRAELRRVEEVLDARLKHIEEGR